MDWKFRGELIDSHGAIVTMTLVTFISAVHAAIVKKSSVFLLISTIYPHRELHIQTLEIPHCVRRCLPFQKSHPMERCDVQKLVHGLNTTQNISCER